MILETNSKYVLLNSSVLQRCKFIFIYDFAFKSYNKIFLQNISSTILKQYLIENSCGICSAIYQLISELCCTKIIIVIWQLFLIEKILKTVLGRKYFLETPYWKIHLAESVKSGLKEFPKILEGKTFKKFVKENEL